MSFDERMRPLLGKTVTTTSNVQSQSHEGVLIAAHPQAGHLLLQRNNGEHVLVFGHAYSAVTANDDADAGKPSLEASLRSDGLHLTDIQAKLQEADIEHTVTREGCVNILFGEATISPPYSETNICTEHPIIFRKLFALLYK